MLGVNEKNTLCSTLDKTSLYHVLIYVKSHPCGYVQKEVQMNVQDVKCESSQVAGFRGLFISYTFQC